MKFVNQALTEWYKFKQLYLQSITFLIQNIKYIFLNF
jgi:hypothetical protein